MYPRAHTHARADTSRTHTRTIHHLNPRRSVTLQHTWNLGPADSRECPRWLRLVVQSYLIAKRSIRSATAASAPYVHSNGDPHKEGLPGHFVSLEIAAQETSLPVTALWRCLVVDAGHPGPCKSECGRNITTGIFTPSFARFWIAELSQLAFSPRPLQDYECSRNITTCIFTPSFARVECSRNITTCLFTPSFARFWM